MTQDLWERLRRTREQAGAPEVERTFSTAGPPGRPSFCSFNFFQFSAFN
ncbi:MAG: hypothetical protein LBU12_03480 [Deltaproteobacteria bacterium]|nr:hypothetical protein [Deltaproteobacteria bacterium]